MFQPKIIITVLAFLVSFLSLSQQEWNQLTGLPGVTASSKVKVFTMESTPDVVYAIRVQADPTPVNLGFFVYAYSSNNPNWILKDNISFAAVNTYSSFQVIEKSSATYFSFLDNGSGEVFLSKFDGSNLSTNFIYNPTSTSTVSFNINESTNTFFTTWYEGDAIASVTQKKNLSTGADEGMITWKTVTNFMNDEVVGQSMFVDETTNDLYLAQKTVSNRFVAQKIDASANDTAYVSTAVNNYVTNASISGSPDAVEAGGSTFNIVKGTLYPSLIYNSSATGSEGVYKLPLDPIEIINAELLVSGAPEIVNHIESDDYANGFILSTTHQAGVFEDLSVKNYDLVNMQTTQVSTDPIVVNQTISEEDISYDLSSNRSIMTYTSGLGDIIIKASNFKAVKQSETQVAACVSSFANLSAGDSILLVDQIVYEDLNNDSLTFNYVSSSNEMVYPTSAATEIRKSNTGSYYLVGSSTGNAGTAYLRYTVSDGFLTYLDSVLISVVNATEPVFTQPTGYEFCTNGNVVDMNSLVDIPGGQFTFGDLIIEDDNYFNPSEYDVSLGLIGNINYFVADANGCVASVATSFFLTEPANIDLFTSNSDCGANNGYVEALITSTAASYETSWNNGTVNANIIENLAPGSYYVTVLDDKGCISIAMDNVEATTIPVMATITNPTCFGADDGGVDITITGLDPATYTVLWSNGSALEDGANFSAGTYEAVITLDNGCSSTQQYVLTEPGEISIENNIILPGCGLTNGAINVSAVTNGLSPFSYTLNGSPAAMNNTSLTGGFYTLQVVDNNGCVAEKMINLPESNTGSVSALVSKTDCGVDNGAIDITISPSGSQSVQSILWSNANVTEDIINLSPDVYTCEVTFDDGCKNYTSWEVKAKKPMQNNICAVTVDSLTTTNLVVWEKVQNAADGISHYNIYRETSTIGQFLLIDTVSVFSESVFNDVVASPLTKSWRYRISAVNNCGVEGPKSVIHKTVHTVFNVDALSNDILVSWDDYEGINYSSADLYRFTTADGWQLIGNDIDINTNSQVDIIPNSLDLNYMIEIALLNTCTATAGKVQDFNTTRSNKTKGIFNPGDGTGDSNNGIEEFTNSDFGVVVYPNPSNGVYTVTTSLKNNAEQLIVTIFDNQGRIVKDVLVGEGNSKIDLTSFAAGAYRFRITNNRETETILVNKF